MQIQICAGYKVQQYTKTICDVAHVCIFLSMVMLAQSLSGSFRFCLHHSPKQSTPPSPSPLVKGVTGCCISEWPVWDFVSSVFCVHWTKRPWDDVSLR
jgi:hypothetical protein